MLGPADMDYILDHAEVRFALIDDNLHAQADRRAALVSNLMVVLCSERDTQPIVNAGTQQHRLVDRSAADPTPA